MSQISSVAFKLACVSITFLLKICRLRINTKNFDEALVKGDIFVFNHFTRLETALPQYILYCLNHDILCYAIAHAPLFKIPVIGEIMRKLGAVPHDHPNLLPMLTEKLSQGYKVVVFPQGKMVKDKESVGMKTGSAILALGTDLWKRHIRCNGDKFDSNLREFAATPTLIVPANISYYPLRIASNKLSKRGEKAKLPNSAIEELTIEGNIILRDTSLNLNFAEPIVVDSSRIDVSGISSIEDCYEILKHHRSERFKIKNSYQDRIYENLVINHGHIFSEILFKLLESDISKVSKYQLRSAMEISCEDLNIDFVEKEYIDLLKLSIDCNLIIKGKHSYTISTMLERIQPFEFVRISNPLKVYANELRPMTEARNIISEAILGSRRVSKDGFVLTPKIDSKGTVMIIHGLFATADQVRPLAEELQEEGYTVYAPLICGHGTSEEDLSTKTWRDWYESVRLCVPEGRFHVVGFSTGGLLAARIAKDFNVLSLTTICAPMKLMDANIRFTKVLDMLRFPKFIGNADSNDTYNMMPVRTLCELLDIIKNSKDIFKVITVRTLITQNDKDNIVNPDSGLEIKRLLPHAELHMLDYEGHDMKGSKELVLEFIRR